MAKAARKVDDDNFPPPPDLKPHELGELNRAAADGDEGGGNDDEDDDDQDWQPSEAPATEVKNKPGRPKKEKEPAKPRDTKPIEIRAAAIKKDMFCHFTYDHNLGLGISNEINVKSEVPVHDDLRNAFRQLVPHLAMIFGALTLDEINAMKPGDDKDHTLLALRKFQIEGFTLDNYDESEGVSLYGSEELPTGTASLETPMIRFFEKRYIHSGALRGALDGCIFEVEEYLHGRKRGDQAQTSFGF